MIAICWILFAVAGPSEAGVRSQTPATVITRAGITCTESVEPATVPLIGEVLLTLTAEGDGRLAVDPVTFADPPGWRVRSAEPATISDQPGGKQQWRAAFRLTPDKPGDLSLPPPSIRVRSGGRETPIEINWPPLMVRVTTTLPHADLGEAHGVTGPEPAPPTPVPFFMDERFWAVGIVVVAIITAILVGRGLRPPPPEPSPSEWAAAELDRLSRTDPDRPGSADALAHLLRSYLFREYRFTATGKTTTELVILLPVESAAVWQSLLDRCDVARFSAAGFSVQEWMIAIEQARVLIGSSLPVDKATASAGNGTTGGKA